MTIFCSFSTLVSFDLVFLDRYLAEALRKSELVTKDINDADLVFVDSYCYYMWWLGWIHTRGREHSDSPADHLIAAYQSMPLNASTGI